MKFQILVCDGPSCGVTHDSDRLVDVVEGTENVIVERFTCFDRCEEGPNLFVRTLKDGEAPDEPDSDLFCAQRGFYRGMDENKLRRVLEQHCSGKGPVDDLVSDY